MKQKTIMQKISRIRKCVLVKDIMSRDVINIDQDFSVFKAIQIMGKRAISTIVIIDGRRPVGIITERDLVKRLLLKKRDPQKTKVAEIMSANPVEIKPNTTIRMASHIMKTKNVRHLVVTNEKHQVVGLISQRDIIQSMNKIYDSYRSLLWNPLFAILLFFMVTLLFIVNFFIFRK